MLLTKTDDFLLAISIFASNSEIFFSHCHSVLVKTLDDSEPSPILQQGFDSLRPSASVPIASKSNSIEDIKTSIAVRITDVRTMPLYSTQSPLYCLFYPINGSYV